MFLVNSRHRHFSATTPSSHSQYAHPKWHPFSRSYGVILPSSLTRVRSNALGYSPHPPVSVSGTVCSTSRYEDFLGSMGSVASPNGSASRLRGIGFPDLPKKPSYSLAPGIPTPGPPTLLRPPFAPTRHHRYGNINPFPISYAFPPRLRGRLTLGRLSLPRKPWVYGEQVFHLFSRYSCQHSHFSAVHSTSRYSFNPQRTLSYQSDLRLIPKLRRHA